MNRQLKFRVWNKKEKKFEELDNFWVSPNNLYKCFMGWHPEIDGEMIYETDETDFIFQQFTELYDKNKKPIYEGDRVKFGYTGDHDFYGEVIWLDDRASFGVKDENTFETFEDLMDYMEYFEVVGNIFELPCNPDHNGECLVCDAWLSDCPFSEQKDE
jgi:hypothetical protein